MAALEHDPIKAAIQAQQSDPFPRLQVANGRFNMLLATPDPTAARAVYAAWLAMVPNQAVPTLWERRDDAEPCFDD